MLQRLLEKLLEAKVGQAIEDEEGNRYTVCRGRNGCRFVRFDDEKILMEQNKKKDSRFAEMARQGRKIGWVIPKQGRWKLVMIKESETSTEDDLPY
jgi:hypothetical protein